MLNNSQIFKAALIVILGFIASGVLGFVRTGSFSAAFGASAELDAFYAAQRIPELLFTLVAGGALGSSFIPVFARYLNKDDMDHAWRLASSTMTLSAVAAGIMALILAVLAPILVPVILVPGKPADQQALTTSLTQIMLITTVIFSISGLAMGILNAHQSFTYPALAASMYNLGMIFGALVIAPNLQPLNKVDMYGMIFGTTQHTSNVYGLALGAILGSVLHFAVQIPGLIQVRARIRWLFNWHVEGVREVLTLMGPRVLGLAVVQINFLVNVAFASKMAEGSQTALSTAWFLLFFVLGVIAQSVGTAIFPTLSALVAANDMENYRARLATAMRSVLFLAFPATVGLILLGQPVVSIFERGAWGAESTQATAWALSFFAIGIAGHSLLEVLSRAFYALADTWTPVKVGVAAMVANIILSVIFIQFIGEADSLVRGPFAGLALANSLTTLLESATLWWLLTRRVNGINDRYILQGAGRALIAALVMGIAVWLVAFIEMPQLVLLGVGVGVGMVVFFGLAIIMRLDEVSIITRRFFKRS